jgi:NADH:ubiquinone oxidoreductase subunit 4 (subunit M)
LVIGAVYMLRAARQILHGPVPEEMSNVADVGGWWRKTPYALLVVALLVFGLWPRGLTDKIRPSAEKLLGASAQSPLQAKAAGVAAKLAD